MRRVSRGPRREVVAFGKAVAVILEWNSVESASASTSRAKRAFRAPGLAFFGDGQAVSHALPRRVAGLLLHLRAR